VTDAYGHNAGHGRKAQCALLEQRTCQDDPDCAALTPHAMTCLRNDRGEGVRVQSEWCLGGLCLQACFAHSQSVVSELCSGWGFYESVTVSVLNSLDAPVDVKFFARNCALDSFGFLPFEGVIDFASANGMCCVRNCYEYWNLTGETAGRLEQGRDRSSRIHNVHDTDYERSNGREGSQTLSGAGVLRAQPHACDCDYQHTDHGVCMKLAASNAAGRLDEDVDEAWLAEATATLARRGHCPCGWCSQSPLPPQSLHWLLRHWCSQILQPP